MVRVAELIDRVLSNMKNEAEIASVADDVRELTAGFSVPGADGYDQ